MFKKTKEDKALQSFIEEYSLLLYSYMYLSYEGTMEAIEKMKDCLVILDMTKTDLYDEVDRMSTSLLRFSFFWRYYQMLIIENLILKYFKI